MPKVLTTRYQGVKFGFKLKLILSIDKKEKVGKKKVFFVEI